MGGMRSCIEYHWKQGSKEPCNLFDDDIEKFCILLYIIF